MKTTTTESKGGNAQHLKDGMGETRDLSTVLFSTIKRQVIRALQSTDTPVELLAELSLRRNQMLEYVRAQPKSIHTVVSGHVKSGATIGDQTPLVESSGHIANDNPMGYALDDESLLDDDPL